VCKEADVNFSDDYPAATRHTTRRSHINAQVTNHHQKVRTLN